MGNQNSVSSVNVLPEEIKIMILNYLNPVDVLNVRQVSTYWKAFVDQFIPLDFVLTSSSYIGFLLEHIHSRLGKLTMSSFKNDEIVSTKLDTLKDLEIRSYVSNVALRQLLRSASNLASLKINCLFWTHANFFSDAARAMEIEQFAAFDSIKNLSVKKTIPRGTTQWIEYLNEWRYILNQDSPRLEEIDFETTTAMNGLFVTGYALFRFLAHAENCKNLRVVEKGDQLGGSALVRFRAERQLIPIPLLNLLLRLKLESVSITPYCKDLRVWYRLFLHQRNLRQLKTHIHCRDTKYGFTINFLNKILENNFTTLTIINLELLEANKTILPCTMFSGMTQLNQIAITNASTEDNIELTDMHKLPSAVQFISFHGFNILNVSLHLFLQSNQRIEEFSIINKSCVMNVRLFQKLLESENVRLCRLQPFEETYETDNEEVTIILESAPSFSPLTFSFDHHRNGMDGYDEPPVFALDKF